jgi:hypothetical protein
MVSGASRCFDGHGEFVWHNWECCGLCSPFGCRTTSAEGRILPAIAFSPPHIIRSTR